MGILLFEVPEREFLFLYFLISPVLKSLEVMILLEPAECSVLKGVLDEYCFIAVSQSFFPVEAL